MSEDKEFKEDDELDESFWRDILDDLYESGYYILEGESC